MSVNVFSTKVLIGHFTVMDGSEAGGDLVSIQTFLLYYANQVVLMLINIFQGDFHNRANEICIKTRSTSASHSLEGKVTRSGPPFYVVIRATRMSSRLLCKLIPSFLVILGHWVMVRPQESIPRSPSLRSSALPTELILPRLYNYYYTNPFRFFFSI